VSDFILQAAVIFNNKGIITGVNEEALKLLNYETAELIGKSLDFIISAEKNFIQKRIIQKLVNKKNISCLKLNYKPKNKKESSLFFSGNYILEDPEKKKPALFIGTLFKDITFSTTDKNLQQTFKELPELLDNILDPLVIASLKGTISFVNQAALKLFGYKAPELIGKNTKIIFKDSGFYHQIFLPKILKRGYLENIETIYKNKEEKTFSVLLSGILLKSPPHQEEGILFTAKNITIQKRTEKTLKKALQELEKNYQTIKNNEQQLQTMCTHLESAYIEFDQIFNSIADGMSIIDTDFNVIKMNKTLFSLTKTSMDNFIGERKKCFEIFKLPICNTEKCILHKILEGSKHVEAEIEKKFHKKEKKTFIVSGSPFKTTNGELVGIVVNYKDISGRKEMERDRLSLEKQLFQTQKLESIGTLAAGIAHEINTPIQFIGDNAKFIGDSMERLLQLIDTYISHLSECPLGEQSKEIRGKLKAAAEKIDLDFLRQEIPEAVAQTKEGITRVSNIVKAMKEFSYRGAEDEKLTVDLNKAIESTITISRNEWKYVADIKTDLDPNIPLVPCFIGEIKQVILNLIVNASHAINDMIEKGKQQKGTITIKTFHDHKMAHIELSDTGSGIPKEIQSKIFDPFFTTKEIGKGTGQGLSLAYSSIVERHKGELSFQTEAGEGTTFIIKIPLEEKKITANKQTIG